MVMNILFACGREISYPRNRLIFQSICRFAKAYSISSNHPSLFPKLAEVAYRLMRINIPNPNAYILGFFGQPLVFPARLRWKGPLILDAFVSTYDTLCFDRKIINPHSILGWMAFLLDRLSCQFSDVVIVDTRAQAEYFQQTFHLPSYKFQVIYVGCDEELFRPIDTPPPEKPTVLFYGTFLPLHGVDVIIQAAYRMLHTQIVFQIIGQGQEYEKARALASKLKTHNIQFHPPVPLEDLPLIISRATICLGGPFGRSDKAQRVITGKTFQCLATGKPTIVSDTPANRELFTHGKNVWMCPVGDPEALANAIQHLLDSPRLRLQLGREGRTLIRQTSGNAVTTQLIRKAIAMADNFYRQRLQK